MKLGKMLNIAMVVNGDLDVGHLREKKNLQVKLIKW